MKVQTSRFGVLQVADPEVVILPEGLMGFEDLRKFFIVDPSDDTMILWFQSMDRSDVAFPMLEPKIFRQDYRVKLSASELRSLKLVAMDRAETLVYSILTIPEDPRLMTANLKAPLVINVNAGVGRQVVLQENEYSVKCSMYKELLALIMEASGKKSDSDATGDSAESKTIAASPIAPSTVKSEVEVTAL